jgi:catechol 2,3-dioxygenase
MKVADQERSLAFYEGALGFKATNRIGNEAAFLSYGAGLSSHKAMRTV